MLFPDELMSALDQEATTEQSLEAETDELSTSVLDAEAVDMAMETEKSQTADTETDSDHNKSSSMKNSASGTTRKKKYPHERAPRRPLVCLPCKKHFTRRSKLDQHNRVVHDMEVTYNCNVCHKTFSRRDNITRHMKHGKCPAHCEQSATDAESSFVSDDTQLLDELSSKYVHLR